MPEGSLLELGLPSIMHTAPSTRVAKANAAMVVADVAAISRITNFLVNVSRAIRSTVRTCTMLSFLKAGRTIECLNSMTISTVNIEPKSIWNAAGSKRSTARLASRSAPAGKAEALP